MSFKLKVLLNLLEIRIQKRIYRNAISALQNKRWKRFNSTLLLSPYYKELVERNTPFLNYPIMDKKLFMENFNKINTQDIDLKNALDIAVKSEKSRDFSPMIKDVTIGLSSGTSGNKGVFLATKSERAQWVAAVLDRVIGFSFKNRNVAFFLRANSNLYNSVKSKTLRFEFFDLYDSFENHITRLNKLNPTILVAQPSMLLVLSEAVVNQKLNIQPQKIISVAEVLYPEDRKILEDTFKQIIHQVYQCTEGFLASTCSHGTLHFNEDFLIIEKKYLDESCTRFHPIITDLLRFSQPIVRYELNDIIHEKKNCECGQNTLAIEKIEGRSDDVLFFQNEDEKNISIYPDFIRRAIIIADNSIQDYTVIQTSENQIELYIDGSDLIYEDAKMGIQELLLKFNIQQVKIVRSLNSNHQIGNKLRRIKNEHNK